MNRVAMIPLADGRSALVDAEDVERLASWRWHAQMTDRKTGRSYVVRRDADHRIVLMHRVITGALPGQIVDHVNGDTFDNRRANLRIVTPRQNSTNSKAIGVVPFKGVRQVKAQFAAAIWPDYQFVNLGRHATPEAAAAIYNAAALHLYGEHARLNPVAPDFDGLAAIAARRLSGWQLIEGDHGRA